MQKTFYTYEFTDANGTNRATVEGERPELISAGWTLLGSETVDVNVPPTLTARQLRLTLIANGLYDTVDAVMEAREKSDPARVEWEYATEFDIDSDLLVATAAALGITQSEIEQMYIDGAKL